MPSKTYRPSQQTKNNLLQKAIDLFNEQGTAAVSLSSLAEALSMSTGHLQYHYRSKEAIICAILEIMFNDWNAMYQEINIESFSMHMLRRILRINFDLVWKYRFFYRELNILLRNDELLAKRYAAIQNQRLAEQEQLARQIAKANGVRLMSKQELHNMVLAGWVLGNSWLSYVESTGQTINATVMDQGVEILMQYYKPYLEKLT